LTNLEVIEVSLLTTPQLMICGLYLNELVMNLVPRGLPSQELYRCYELALTTLSSGVDIEPLLRRFEFHLLKLSGYGPQLDFEAVTDQMINPESNYHYDNERGPVLSAPDAVKKRPVISGRTLLVLKALQMPDAASAKESKLLLRGIIDYQLNGKPLTSREIMRYLKRSSAQSVWPD
jgi:DNA repair protein RecO (recombination protein O)